MYKIEQNSKTPLHIQLYNELKKDIMQNYTIDDKIPSIRKIATTYNLSKNTVESAFSQLVVEGFIDSYPKSGYFVTDTKHSNFISTKPFEAQTFPKDEEILYDFFPARLHKDSFPLKLWKRLFTKTINDSIDLGAYSDNQGELSLRIQIAKYLNTSRAVNCQAEQIVLCNGFADSMGLLAILLNKTHDTLSIEDPGYHVVRRVFENHNYKINKIQIDKNGLCLEKLKNSKLIYITPSHQYPTGVAMPISNRIKLLEFVQKENSYIIEDDYDSELSYANRPIPSLQGLDSNDTVIYVGTFSKALSPAIRVSYIVMPPKLLEEYKQKFSYHASRVCLMTQKTLEKFIEDGYWDKHLRKIRTLNKKKHNLMKKLLEEKLGNTMQIESQGGGLAILINPSTDNFDWVKLEKLAKKEKIKLHFAKERTGGKWQALMMGFGGFNDEELEKAITAFSKIWFECF